MEKRKNAQIILNYRHKKRKKRIFIIARFCVIIFCYLKYAELIFKVIK